jgi:predicted urease superfamily metal-dependent hydrolase
LLKASSTAQDIDWPARTRIASSAKSERRGIALGQIGRQHVERNRRRRDRQLAVVEVGMGHPTDMPQLIVSHSVKRKGHDGRNSGRFYSVSASRKVSGLFWM